MADMISRLGPFAIVALLAMPAMATQQAPTNASPARPGGTLLGRPSPPQPMQRQALEYFTGVWTFSWTGRESPFSPGPRKGTVTYVAMGTAPFLEFRTEGAAEGTGAYKETGTLAWHAGQKVLAVHERLAGGLELMSIGDWTSPISIRFESAPLTVEGQRFRLRRTYGIVSAHSFTVADELSTNDGPFMRLGGGVFTKSAP
jgi:hypothetical protein